MDEIKIDQGVPLPPDKPRLRPILDKLEVHDPSNPKCKSSFAVPLEQYQYLRTAVSNAHRDMEGKRFTIKRVKERHPKTHKLVTVARVWRTQ